LTPHYEKLIQLLKALPGLGYRSAERIALHLLVEKTSSTQSLIESLQQASEDIGPCQCCGNLTESELCQVCESSERDDSLVCVVESVPDLFAMERSGAYRGKYHVLHGKLSPIRGVGPERLNLDSLRKRIEGDCITEVILALGNDMEGEATCHYLKEVIIADRPISVSRIGFGLPSGGNVTFADEVTLRSALDGRTQLERQ
jgi:recombination protein RecR